LSELIRIIDRRRDKVCGGDDGDFFVQTIDSRVVIGKKPDKEIGVIEFG